MRREVDVLTGIEFYGGTPLSRFFVDDVFDDE
jgi:hypothetical protein